MGDRAYVLIRGGYGRQVRDKIEAAGAADQSVSAEAAPGVWLYCHSWGIEIPYLVRDLLLPWKSRWDSPGQLASIIFCAMVERYRRFQYYPVSFSIDAEPAWPDHPDLVIDTDRQTISFVDREVREVPGVSPQAAWERPHPEIALWRDSLETYALLVDDDLRQLLARIEYGGDEVSRWVPTYGRNGAFPWPPENGI